MTQSFTSNLPTPLPVTRGGTGVTTSTGTGNVVLSTSPTLVTPALGTPASGTLTNCTGLPYAGLIKPSTAFFVQRGSNQSISNSTFTKVQLNTESFDAGGYFDSTTNYRYTPLVAGKYLFVFNGVLVSPAATGQTFQMLIYKNGTQISYNATFPTGGAYVVTAGSIIVDMNGSTDYIELYTYQAQGSSKDIFGDATTPYTFLSGGLMI